MAQAIAKHAGSTHRGQKPAFTQGILDGVFRFLARRRTQRELSRLDDRMLADIGLSRGDIHIAAAQAVGTRAQKKTPIWANWLSLVQRARTRARMVRDLHRLPNHILDDIGIQRWQIEDEVDGILAKNDTKDESLKTETDGTSPVHDLLRRVEAATWPFRRWQMSRVAAGQMARLNRDTLADLGYVKGDVDWVPEVLAERHLRSAANRNQAREVVA